jgi:hypothetical protein
MLFADATKCNCREISAWGSRNVREIKFVKLKTVGALKFSLCHVFYRFFTGNCYVCRFKQ